MIESVLAFLTSGSLGAVTGLLGSWLTKVEDRKTLQIANAHEEAMAEIGLREMDKELDIARLDIDKAEAEGFVASLKDVRGGWMDKAKAIVRPLITLYLLIVTSYITYTAWGVASTISPDLLEQVVQQVLFLTNLAISWWFGARPAQPRRA